MIRRDQGGDNGGKGEGLTGTIIKDIWTITRGGWKQEWGCGGLGWWGGVGGKGRKLHLNNNKNFFKLHMLQILAKNFNHSSRCLVVSHYSLIYTYYD